MSPALLEAETLRKRYGLPRANLWGASAEIAALDGVSLRIEAGRNFGIVGESGSGKSTLARMLMALERPSSGSVRILGLDLAALSRRQLRHLRRHFQMVFQDPYGSLDPRQRIGRIVAEPLHVLGGRRTQDQSAVVDVLQSVGLQADDIRKYPHQFSGGQRQRIAIARALVTKPKLIIADEPLSALDVSVQAQVLNLLQDLTRDHGVTLVLISHDLAVVDHICDEVAVMYRGRIVEQGAPQTLFARPAHPYTRMLIEAMPRLAPRSVRHRLTPRTESDAAGGCAFAARCAFVRERCRAEAPSLVEIEARHVAACHFGATVMREPLR